MSTIRGRTEPRQPFLGPRTRHNGGISAKTAQRRGPTYEMQGLARPTSATRRFGELGPRGNRRSARSSVLTVQDLPDPVCRSPAPASVLSGEPQGCPAVPGVRLQIPGVTPRGPRVPPQSFRVAPKGPEVRFEAQVSPAPAAALRNRVASAPSQGVPRLPEPPSSPGVSRVSRSLLGIVPVFAGREVVQSLGHRAESSANVSMILLSPQTVHRSGLSCPQNPALSLASSTGHCANGVRRLSWAALRRPG
jgi:hypothetical protein